ncbi:hypothetical protein [Priestia megaterium]|uniref:hypothetical protein n=1 Tax=Priestia megaterium TaxID=1404 RepID=UPI002877332D|nr:hypothetical protein [Priestia megaterium]
MLGFASKGDMYVLLNDDNGFNYASLSAHRSEKNKLYYSEKDNCYVLEFATDFFPMKLLSRVWGDGIEAFSVSRKKVKNMNLAILLQVFDEQENEFELRLTPKKCVIKEFPKIASDSSEDVNSYTFKFYIIDDNEDQKFFDIKLKRLTH